MAAALAKPNPLLRVFILFHSPGNLIYPGRLCFRKCSAGKTSSAFNFVRLNTMMREVVKWKKLVVPTSVLQLVGADRGGSSARPRFDFSLPGLLSEPNRKTKTFMLEDWLRNLPLLFVSCLLSIPANWQLRTSKGRSAAATPPRNSHTHLHLTRNAGYYTHPAKSFYSSPLNFVLSNVRHASNFHSERNPPSNDENKSDQQKPKRPPGLMNMPHIIWPSVFLSIKNWFITKVIIQPYFDSDFNLTEFMKGAKQALVFVSSQLAEGNFEALEGLVAFNALQEIKRNHAALNMKQRQELQINPEEVYFCAPYQIGIIMDDSSNQRFAEITVIYHCLRGIEDIRRRDPPLNEMAKYTDYITICNYRFIREYTKGVQSEWMINALNHFKLN